MIMDKNLKIKIPLYPGLARMMLNCAPEFRFFQMDPISELLLHLWRLRHE